MAEENAGEGDVALGRRHFLLYVMSGRYADKYRFETTPEELDYLFSGTRRKLVVEDAFSELRGDFAPPPLRRAGAGRDLRLRYETGAPAVRVWELVRAGETPGGDVVRRRHPARALWVDRGRELFVWGLRCSRSVGHPPSLRVHPDLAVAWCASLLVFAFLCCLYALTGGGQGSAWMACSGTRWRGAWPPTRSRSS